MLEARFLRYSRLLYPQKTLSTRVPVRVRAHAQVRTWHWSANGTGAKAKIVLIQVWHDSCYNSNYISIYIGRDIFPLYNHHHYQKCKTNRTCI